MRLREFKEQTENKINHRLDEVDVNMNTGLESGKKGNLLPADVKFPAVTRLGDGLKRKVVIIRLKGALRQTKPSMHKGYKYNFHHVFYKRNLSRRRDNTHHRRTYHYQYFIVMLSRVFYLRIQKK